ncbi:MAG: methylenetetrahydrofolate reductase [NAD(P)H] [Methylococcaceae bacterium]|nr:methylenetetrahydrofolate reductase [NAD(P)H] [Methylococcaceae bacterium]MCI0733926.1 methylenetetrahydrofolate reductase [NAD(P)H] [Methylococcaceae bacterium]
MITKTAYKKDYSFEFFPPRSPEAEQQLIRTSQDLAGLHPLFFSVTFGAGGTTRAKTRETVIELKNRTGIEAAPHISCIGSTRSSVQRIIQDYRDQGIRRIVALRGDMPSGMMEIGQFRYANELVEFIRAETGDYFHIHVAAYPEMHPQAPNIEADLKNFKRKVEAGADDAITQYFYNSEAYFRFVDACLKAGLDIPIIPGVMPIGNFFQLSRFSEACGADIPRWMRKRFEYYADNRDSVQALGIDIVTTLCQNLLDNGAPGIHFYTMNRSDLVRKIWDRLDIE